MLSHASVCSVLIPMFICPCFALDLFTLLHRIKRVNNSCAMVFVLTCRHHYINFQHIENILNMFLVYIPFVHTPNILILSMILLSFKTFFTLYLVHKEKVFRIV